MADETTIPQSYKTTFKDNLRHGLQQKTSKFRHAVDEAPYSGEGAMAVDLLGETDAQDETDRYGDTPLMIPDHQARWVYPSGKEWGTLVTSYDKVREITDPTSKLHKNAEMAFARKIDAEIVSAFFSAAKVGKAGGNTVNFPDSQKIGVQVGSGDTPADVGLNYDKLTAALEKLALAEFDPDDDPVYCGITAIQNTNLMNEIELISSQYNVKPTISNGKIVEYMGINFIHYQKLPKSGNNRLIPLWAKSGMHLGMWNDIEIEGGKDAGKKFNFRLYGKLVCGATRTEEEKVIQIACKEG